jgi:hypothetical protein
MVQPVASHYTDCTTAAVVHLVTTLELEIDNFHTLVAEIKQFKPELFAEFRVLDKI